MSFHVIIPYKVINNLRNYPSTLQRLLYGNFTVFLRQSLETFNILWKELSFQKEYPIFYEMLGFLTSLEDNDDGGLEFEIVVIYFVFFE